MCQLNSCLCAGPIGWCVLLHLHLCCYLPGLRGSYCDQFFENGQDGQDSLCSCGESDSCSTDQSLENGSLQETPGRKPEKEKKTPAEKADGPTYKCGDRPNRFSGSSPSLPRSLDAQPAIPKQPNYGPTNDDGTSANDGVAIDDGTNGIPTNGLAATSSLRSPVPNASHRGCSLIGSSSS